MDVVLRADLVSTPGDLLIFPDVTIVNIRVSNFIAWIKEVTGEALI